MTTFLLTAVHFDLHLNLMWLNTNWHSCNLWNHWPWRSICL